MPPQSHRRAAESFGSVLSFEDLEIDIDTVIGDGGFPTNALVNEARTITTAWRDATLRKYKDSKVFVGIFLDALLDFAGKDPIPDRGIITGERYTAGVIYAAYKDGKVFEVAQVWFESMVQPMKPAGYVRTVEPSDEQTPDLNDTENMVEPATRSRQRRMRWEVCKRHNHRCILHPLEVDEKSVPLPDSPNTMIDAMTLCLEVAHIIPFSLNDFAVDDNGEAHSSAVNWVMIKNWTSVPIQNLMGDGIYDSSNGILLCSNGHSLFGSFKFWFEPTRNQHCYVVRSRLTPLNGMSVNFRSTSGISPPDPRYLAIHAAFAKVLRASGAAEYLESIFRDQEEIAIARDGSTDISSLLANKFASVSFK
ncbi:hypothetical protein BU17DRAFT_93153 [Hysterangium stoloniferum]|nr:hypothetical protein BU17DRAFT_93153 [Hysterangium stoloniferum]